MNSEVVLAAEVPQITVPQAELHPTKLKLMTLSRSSYFVSMIGIQHNWFR
jgi:hypothetical protein